MAHRPFARRSPVLIDFHIPGEPFPQPRARFAPRIVKGRVRVQAFTDPESPVIGYRDAVKLSFRAARPRGWPTGATYRILVVLIRTPPKALAAKYRTRNTACAVLPDADNYLKAVKDALKGEAWADDGQVYDARAVKVYARAGERPGTRVVVYAAGPRPAFDVSTAVAAFVAENVFATQGA